MPQGQAHYLPPGLWYQTPTNANLKILLAKSVLKFCAPFAFLYAIAEYRALTWKYSTNRYIGRSIIFGKQVRHYLKHNNTGFKPKWTD